MIGIEALCSHLQQVNEQLSVWNPPDHREWEARIRLSGSEYVSGIESPLAGRLTAKLRFPEIKANTYKEYMRRTSFKKQGEQDLMLSSSMILSRTVKAEDKSFKKIWITKARVS